MWATGTVTITFESYTFVKPKMSCRKEAPSVIGWYTSKPI